MVIKKKAKTFNDYDCTVSWGQLNAMYKALEGDHADPLADELFAELGWYLENVPGPGEDEEQYKQAKEAEKQAMAGGEDGEIVEPGAGAEGQELLGQEVEAPPGDDVEGAEGPVAPDGPEPPPAHDERDEPQEADQYLERPPAAVPA